MNAPKLVIIQSGRGIKVVGALRAVTKLAVGGSPEWR